MRLKWLYWYLLQFTTPHLGAILSEESENSEYI